MNQQTTDAASGAKVDDEANNIVDAQMEGNPHSQSNTMLASPQINKADTMLSPPDEAIETALADSSTQELSRPSGDGNLDRDSTETNAAAPIDGEDGQPTGVSDGEQAPRSRPQSRLSLLLTLRPSRQTPSSILRRRVAPLEPLASENGNSDVKDVQVPQNDGTILEELRSNPTSDRHFDALANFEASSIPLTSTANQKTANGDEVLVIGFETLCGRLNMLFPDLFPRPSEMVRSRRQRRCRSASVEISSKPPCIFPRLIACYTIYRDYQRHAKISSSNGSDSERSPKRRRTLDGVEEINASSSFSETVESLSVIRNLLQKLVDLERVTLEGHEHRNADEGTSTPSISPSNISAVESFWRTVKIAGPRKRRRVQFAAFDDKTVVRAPSDVLEGSYKPQENFMKALMAVLNAAEELFPNAVSTSQTPSILEMTDSSLSSDAAAVVSDFIFYLDKEFIPQCHDTICVESLMAIEKQNIPVIRVQKAAYASSQNLNTLINPKGDTIKRLYASALDNEGDSTSEEVVVPLSIETVDVFVPSRLLIWERKMADATAQHIRFWLRTILNDQPERIDSDTKSDQWKTRLSDYVIVKEVDEEHETMNIGINKYENIYDENNADRSVPIEEDSCTGEKHELEKPSPNIASLMSNALSYIYSYLQLGSDESATCEKCLSWKDRLLKVIPDESCCATIVCREGFGTKRKPVYLVEEDWQDLRDELEKASYFAAFHKGALFVERLLSVLETLGLTDHWEETVQASARKLLKMKGAILPDDEHLVLLAMSPRELLIRLRTEILPTTWDRYQICRANMRKTAKNFRLGFGSTPKKKKCQPQVGNLESYWLNNLYPSTLFESISYYIDDGEPAENGE